MGCAQARDLLAAIALQVTKTKTSKVPLLFESVEPRHGDRDAGHVLLLEPPPPALRIKSTRPHVHLDNCWERDWVEIGMRLKTETAPGIQRCTVQHRSARLRSKDR